MFTGKRRRVYDVGGKKARGDAAREERRGASAEKAGNLSKPSGKKKEKTSVLQEKKSKGKKRLKGQFSFPGESLGVLGGRRKKF